MSSIDHILPHIRIFILLMEEILHHLGCIKPCKRWDKLPTSTGAFPPDFWTINSTLYPHHLNLQNLLFFFRGPFPLDAIDSSPECSFRWGPFLCRFDADDVMHKERLEHQLEVLRNLSLCQRRFFGVQFFFRVFQPELPDTKHRSFCRMFFLNRKW